MTISRVLRERLLVPVYRLYRWRLWNRIRRGPVPEHLALILDGNRRYAERSGLASLRDGYAAGAERVDDVIHWCQRAGVGAVTVWAMSVQNLGRPEDQIQALSSVMEEQLRAVVPRARAQGWRLRGIGRREVLSPALREALERAEGETRENGKITVQFALGYGGREEIVDALKRWAQADGIRDLPVGAALARLEPDDVTPHLYAGDLPDPDLILRTSGEVRLSGFLLWQSVHSEFYFTDVLWPEFREVDFLRALRDYQARKRRFGL